MGPQQISEVDLGQDYGKLELQLRGSAFMYFYRRRALRNQEPPAVRPAIDDLRAAGRRPEAVRSFARAAGHRSPKENAHQRASYATDRTDK